MADYWKSQPRKFCDYCKCWITDNKPSVEFHEKGKRHQENVKNRISEIRKKGIADYKKQEEMNDSMKEMERAALEALKKDLKSDPSMAAQYGIQIDPDKKINFVEKKDKDKSEEPSEETAEKTKDETSKEQKDSEIIEWFEAVSDEGYTYYWNICSGESVWVAPEKYKSLAEQNKTQEEDGEKKDTANNEKSENFQEEEVETLDVGAVGPMPMGASTSRRAYGGWQKVKQEEMPDLQLPDSNVCVNVDEPAENVVVPEEPKIKFREKKVSSSAESGGFVAFKKRKVAGGASRSIRRRDEDS